MTANRCKDCGHEQVQHGLVSGACYSGYDDATDTALCPCRAFVPDDKPATASPAPEGAWPAVALDTCAALRAERDEALALQEAGARELDEMLDRILATETERDELREALELFVTFHSGHVLPGTLAPAMIAGRAALTKGSNDE